MRKLYGSFLSALSFIITLAILGTFQLVEAEDKSEILIGTNLSLTGGLSQLCTEQQWVYEQAISDINKKGGVFIKEYNKKLPLRLIVEDAESDPGKAAAAIERLVKVDKVDLLLAGQSTPLTLPSCVAAEKLKVYYHASLCVTPPWETQNFKWSTVYFFNAEQAASVPFALLDTIPVSERPKNLALILEDSADGKAMGPIWQSEGKKAGYNFVLVENFPVGAKDFSSMILKMKMEKVDAAIMFAMDEAITIVRQMKGAGLGLKYFHIYKGALANEYWDALGQDAQYVLADGWWDENFPYPLCKELGQRFKEKFNKPSKIAGLYYALVQTLVTAIEKAGTINSAAVRQAVLSTEFKNTTMGDLKYNEKGVANFVQGAFQWIDGKQMLVYPFDVSGGNKVKIAPPWKQR